MTDQPITRGDLDHLEHGMRRELRLTVALGLLGGQALASLMTTLITHLSPAKQASVVAAATYRLFF